MFVRSAGSKELAQYGVRHYDRQNGLSASSVLEIQQTRDGYLWIGTYDGLNRFDGVTMRVFNRENTPQLESENITSIYQTKDGVLWIGSMGKGVKGYLDSNLKHPKPGSLLPDLIVNDLIEDTEGSLFMATRTGLYVFQNETWKLLPLVENDPSCNIISLAIGDEGELLAATVAGIYVWKNGTSRLLDDQIPKDIKVQGFAFARGDGLWIGTFRSGLYHWKGGTLEHFTTEEGLLNDNIGDLVFDPSGHLWIGGREGVSILKNGAFSHYRMPGHMIYSLEPDSEDGMWIGTYLQGLYRFGDTKFSSYTNSNHTEVSVIGRAIIEWQGILLIGTNLGIFELKNGYLEKSPIFDALDKVLIRSIEPASDGGLWIASHTDGIIKVFPNRTLRFYSKEEGLSSVTNRSVIEAKDGTVWIGGDAGLQFMRDGEIRDFAEIQGHPVLSIHELKDGGIVVTMDSDGFYIIRDNGLEHYTKADGLNSDIVFYAHEDENGDLWVSMSDSGIGFLHEGHLSMLQSEDGIPHDSIFYILDDHRGNFWMACNSGIYSVDKAQLQQRVKGRAIIPHSIQYDKMDGITSGGVTSVTHPYLASDGQIWFPTTQGVVSVNPVQLSSRTMVPRVIIESFDTELEKFEIDKDDPIEVNAGTRRFTFSFTGLSFESGEKTRYRVRMNGFDKEFITIGNRREYAYTNLPPGHYTFEVNVDDSEGNWSDSTDSVSFILKPHFYQTWVFIVSMGLLFLISGIVISLLRIDRVRKRQQLLQRLVDQRTADLKKATIDAEQANESKSYFLASVSHEVRNPMNGIVGISELLLDSNLDDLQKKYVNIIRNSSQTLVTILNDLLDYSKIDSDKLQLEKIPFSVQSIINESLDLQEANIREKSLSLSVDVDMDIPELLSGDPLRHRQVLNNLISNAVKFTEKGGIDILVSIMEQTDESIELCFSVKDSGIGISDEAQNRLFKVYEQADSSTARTHGGTGLGLAICRSLVELMEGRIWVESEPGIGSTFLFTSRLAKIPTSNIPHHPSEKTSVIIANDSTDSSDLKILVVDDEKMNLDIARLVFKKLGYEIDCAISAEEAAQKLAFKNYDMMFIDFYMPIVDGATLARRVTSGSVKSQNPDVYIVAITGATSSQDTEILLNAGIQTIIHKPLTLDEIRNSLETFCSEKRQKD